MLENKRVLKWINVICVGLSVILTFYSALLIGYASTKVDDNPFRGMVVMLLGFYIVIFVTLLLHELGHVFFGRLAGYRMVAFGVLKWNLLFKDGKITLVKKQSLMGVGAQYFGVKASGTVAGDILMFSGGIIVHGLLILVALVFGFVTKNWAIMQSLICLQLGLIFLNINPNGITDGAKILELYLHPDHAPYMYREMERAEQLLVAPDQADLADFVQDVPLERGGIVQAVYLNNAESLMYQGLLEEAGDCLEAIYSFTENTMIKMASGASLLFVSLLQEDNAKAEQLYQDKMVRKILHHPQTQLQVCKAYYEWLILKDVKKATKTILQAEKLMATSYLLRDEKQFYQKQIKQLLDALS